MIAAVTLICAVVVLAYCLHVINHMGRGTDHFVRLAFIVLCFGEFALLAGALFGYNTAARFEVMAINAAVLLFAVFDRRRQRFAQT